MLEGGYAGEIETRRAFDGSTVLAGRFPYGAIADFGRGRTETFEPGAFADSVQSNADQFFLFGHDYNRPLARRGTDFTLSDDGASLAFEARISPDALKISFVADAVAAIESGLVLGISPGFVVDSPKDQFVKKSGDGLRRHIRKARLTELSAVTRAAYPDAQVEARYWQAAAAPTLQILDLGRWR